MFYGKRVRVLLLGIYMQELKACLLRLVPLTKIMAIVLSFLNS
jgi:hypothetical protein